MSSSSTLSTLIRHTLPNLSEDEVRSYQSKLQQQLTSTSTTSNSTTTTSSRGSRLVPDLVKGSDWSSLIDEANRLVIKRSSGTNRSLSDSALKFAQLAARLRTQAIPRDKAQTLSFLLSLADSTFDSDHDASRPAHSTTTSRTNTLLRTAQPVNTTASSSRPLHTPTYAAPLPRAPKLPMAAILAQHRTLLSSTTPDRLPPVPETKLLRDILYIIQGIDGQFVKFKSNPSPSPSSGVSGPKRTFKRGEIIIDDTPEPVILEQGIVFTLEGKGYSLSAPMRVLLHTLSELGWLFKKIDNVLEAQKDQSFGSGFGAREIGEERSVGMIEQSLHAVLKSEMTEYYRLVAILETQFDGEENEDRGVEEEAKEKFEGRLTLRRLMVWTEEIKLRMRMMGTLVEETGGDNIGGALLTSLHSRTSNGDPFIRDFSTRLLRTLSVPFFSTLSAWIYEGELVDPFGEFFVELNPALSDAGQGRADELGQVGALDLSFQGEEEGVRAHQLWEGKFRFKMEMLPGFLGESFGRKIFSTGKSLNFMKYSCDDSKWVASRPQADGAQKNLEYADIIGLEQSITAAYSHTSKRLFDIFFDKFRLMDHLKALKDYLMLGKGDFVEILMESLGPSLERPANLLYRHNLTATLESALRGSSSNPTAPHSAQTNDVTRRLDARMLEFTQGEIGWDVFTLEYKVDAPLDTILDPDSMEGYLKMFKHLWQIKRVEYALNGVQRRLMTGARTTLKVPELAYDFHRTRISLQRMTFFIRQLQYYCHLEVIACSWQVLEEFALKKQGDLDSLIGAHKAYLDRLVTKALLINPRKSSKKDSAAMLELVRSMFKVMLQFRDVAVELCNFAAAEAVRDQAQNATLAARNADKLDLLRIKLEDYSNVFSESAKELVHSLGKARDLDMRFLAVRLSFNYHFV